MNGRSIGYEERKWYNNSLFPFTPQIAITKADDYNTKRVSFHWLFIKFWTLDHPSIEAGIVFDQHWGIGFIFLLPYLRLALCLPNPINEEWVNRYLHRKSRKHH